MNKREYTTYLNSVCTDVFNKKLNKINAGESVTLKLNLLIRKRIKDFDDDIHRGLLKMIGE